MGKMFLLLEKQHLTHSWSTCFKVVATVAFFPDVAVWSKESFEAFFVVFFTRQTVER